MSENALKPASHEISLSQAVGRDIHDVYGYMGDPFDCGEPSFQVTRIIFTDGTSVHLDGEHDSAYIADPPPGVKWPAYDDGSGEDDAETRVIGGDHA